MKGPDLRCSLAQARFKRVRSWPETSSVDSSELHSVDGVITTAHQTSWSTPSSLAGFVGNQKTWWLVSGSRYDFPSFSCFLFFYMVPMSECIPVLVLTHIQSYIRDISAGLYLFNKMSSASYVKKTKSAYLRKTVRRSAVFHLLREKRP